MLLAHLKFGLLSVNPKCNFQIRESGDVGNDECYSGNTILYGGLNQSRLILLSSPCWDEFYRDSGKCPGLTP